MAAVLLIAHAPLASALLSVAGHCYAEKGHLFEAIDVEPPALIKGYLRMGAKVLGAPAWDPEFGTADLPMLTRVADIPARYKRHFLG